MENVRKIRIIAVLVIFFTVIGCGFKFTGSGSLPKATKTVAVTVFDNKTTYTGLGNTMSNMMVSEISRFGTAQITTLEKADAILKGKIISIQAGTIAHKTLQVPTERRVWITIEAMLVTKEGEILWESDLVTDSETYLIGGDHAISRRNEQKAVEIAMKRIAETMYYRMVSDF